MIVVDVLTAILLGLGGLACVTGALGLVRFPDIYARIHAGGITDTLGVLLIVLGLLLHTALGDHGWVWGLVSDGPHGAVPGLLVSIKLVSIIFFLWVSGSTATHALAKAAWLAGVEPWTPEGAPPAVEEDAP